ncbi:MULTISPECIES: lysine N(6)-hydroxylase/L-ornithine N(5)-oxygenase family protein [unclassified Streptomyces]|uniref:lysine N(6)-hydroxylase/L-ornithine N(5)-oxygenase family protein n=1 Tax=unclassified Streptomyces TaxID=2593676 RepID=UPI0022B68271|nr:MULTISPECIES: SidA/IucD/PvdA family monooxygenase [unclassified Streptomyces]MCZ7413677.1 SidA/IucD/PvdA family monooxygenase [Streptomyces sp. WMMC897]MCZ7430672.1 SidA/IucD/PvdA family monooxygenase [Streptomyces sp. WMMC1477]
MTAQHPTHDLVGIGIGPFNLSLAALADRVPTLSALFLDSKPAFSWHPGLLMEGTTLQVPFLADLVTMADPTNPWSYLNYLRHHQRMFPFFFSERFHIPRREYDHYCRWVADNLPNTRFDAHVTAVTWNETDHTFTVTHQAADGTTSHVSARQLVLGTGTQPTLPPALQHLATPEHTGRVLHSADYRTHRTTLATLDDVTVIGAGQSGAEVTLDLIRHQDGNGHGGPHTRWLARTPAFAPMEYSKIGLEHFTPDYIDYFRALPDATRKRLTRQQWQLYKGVSEETLGEIHDELYERTIGGGRPRADLHPGVEITAAHHDGKRYTITCHHTEQQRDFTIHTDAIVAATGYTPQRPALLDPLLDLIDLDTQGRYQIDGDYRVALDPRVTGALYVQNAEMHTHGVGAPDLTLGAWRAATILNAATGRPTLPVPRQTSWTTFGAPTTPHTPTTPTAPVTTTRP